MKRTEKNGKERLEAYRRQMNAPSVDRAPTCLFDESGGVAPASDATMLRPEGDEL